MIRKYNRSLDLIACAQDAYARGKVTEASRLMTQAFKDPSMKDAAAAMLQHNQSAVEAAADSDLDEDFVGEELRLEPDEQDARKVQTARRSATASTERVSSARSRAQDYFASLKK
jgi:hypothetical protein